MRLSELYREKLTKLAMLVAATDASDDATERMCLKSSASCRQQEAGYIAHCLAYFGDQEISALVHSDALHQAREFPCQFENPLARGIALLHQDFLA
ncbi:hypothetical protein [Burkholderia gladioli]|uniref:hypothetical protein n=1 Tax=Burkholderia gladioli TaxID=28095 RepID=UPI00163FC2E4|nr:hypothetical protein [Burkholderia gladioli]